MASPLNPHERAVLLAAMRLDSALHDLPAAAVADALLVRAVLSHGAQGFGETEFVERCAARFRSMSPGFALLSPSLR